LFPFTENLLATLRSRDNYIATITSKGNDYFASVTLQTTLE
jgi:hypothetical protein